MNYFNVSVSVYKALNGLSSQYLADDCQLTTVLSTDDDFDRPASLHRLEQIRVIALSLLRTASQCGLEQRRGDPLRDFDYELGVLGLRRLLKMQLFC